MDNNPELAQQGIKVGDVIGISATPQVQEEPQTFVKEEDVEAQVRKLKKD
jgi:hypothetical protein